MQSRPSRWATTPYEVTLAEALADGLGVSPAVGTVLARRGFREVEDARAFLAAEERHDPLALPGVAEAAELIRAHAGRGSRIAVFGDYDVDGVCSTAMLVRTLRAARRRAGLGAAQPLRRGLRAVHRARSSGLPGAAWGCS